MSDGEQHQPVSNIERLVDLLPDESLAKALAELFRDNPPDKAKELAIALLASRRDAVLAELRNG